jgi:hypothetical protein
MHVLFLCVLYHSVPMNGIFSHVHKDRLQIEFVVLLCTSIHAHLYLSTNGELVIEFRVRACCFNARIKRHHA